MIRRLRAHLGLWGLVALIGLAAVFTLAATPRTVNRVSDTALRQMIGAAPYSTRDLMFIQPTPDAGTIGRLGATAEGFPTLLERRMSPVLADAIGQRWGAMYTAELGTLSGEAVSTAPDGALPGISVWHQPDLAAGIRLVSGRAPENPDGATELEVMAAAEVAQGLGLRLGQVYPVAAESGVHASVLLVGVYEAHDPGAPDWEAHPFLLHTGVQQISPDTRRATGALLTDQAGMLVLRQHAVLWKLLTTARFRLDERRLHAGQAAAARDAVRQLDTDPDLGRQRIFVQTRLDELISGFERQYAAVRALLAVVGAGVLGTALGLLVIAARLAVDRRRTELRLLRARGASLARLVRTVGAEAGTLVLPAAAAGWGLHHLVPGRAAPVTSGALWPLVAVAFVAIAAVPLAMLATGPNLAATEHRPDLVTHRSGPWRLTAEVTVLVLAALGVLLLRRRGLTAAGVDPYLSVVPLLVGTAVGLLALRAYPWPVRLLTRVSNRRRGPVAFLGLARAGRRTTTFALPLVVLVLAVSLGGFAATVRTGVLHARGVAAALEVGADFRLTAGEFVPGAEQTVAAVPGVDDVLAARRLPELALVVYGNIRPDNVAVVVVDPARYQRLLESHGVDLRLPRTPLEPVSGAQPGARPVPVAASPAVARLFDGSAALAVGDASVPVRLAGTVDRLPGLDDGRDEFLLVAADAIGTDTPVTTLLVTGAGAEPDALARAAGEAADGAPVELTSLADQRRALRELKFNDAVTLAFAVGQVSATVAAVLAVMLALVFEARARGRVLSLLRTMGLSIRQARAVLLVELAPPVAAALLVGALAGAALPVLLAPALGLSAFTGGVPLRPQFDPAMAGVLVGLAVALLTGAVLTEAGTNRRLGLGQVLRVGVD